MLKYMLDTNICIYLIKEQPASFLDRFTAHSVGDIRVSNGRAGYRLVNASAGIGDVSGDGYGETSGWLGKSLKYHGDGKYELRAHVGVGDIRLEGK